MRATITWEYEANPKHYQSGDAEGIAEEDLASMSENPIEFLATYCDGPDFLDRNRAIFRIERA